MGKRDLSAELQECEKVLEKLMNHVDAEPFKVPVDWKGWGLLDYPKIIKEPMDLSTVQTNLGNMKYQSIAEFSQDVKLIWKNCMTYNADGSSYYRIAQKFDKLFDKEIGKVAKKFGTSTKALKDAIKPATHDEKSRFCKNMYDLRATAIGKVVNSVNDNCPQALDKSNPEQVEINIDLIDPVTFRKLEHFIKECSAKEKQKKKIKKKEKEREKEVKAKEEQTTTSTAPVVESNPPPPPPPPPPSGEQVPPPAVTQEILKEEPPAKKLKTEEENVNIE